MAGTPPDFLVRFPTPRGTVGVGFVVGAEHVLTWAHVVNAALGHDPLRQDKPDQLVIEGERLPAGLRPARLSQEAPPGGEVRLFGYPKELYRPAGGWVTCRLHEQVGNGLLQLDSDPAAV